MATDTKNAWDWAHYSKANSGHSRAFLEAVDLLRGAQTHLLDGDNSLWRKRLDAFLRQCAGSEEIAASQSDGGDEHG
jgi:hypothetical protein